MERKAIGIQGISTGSNYDDGACLNMINMRHEQGVLKPVESFPVDFTLKHVYDLLYWHKNNDYSNLIGVRNNGVYWVKNEGTQTETEELLLPVSGPVVLSHIGNIINVLDGDVLKYIYWQNGVYYVIDLNLGDKQYSIIPQLNKVGFVQNGYTVTRSSIEGDQNVYGCSIDNTFQPENGKIKMIIPSDKRIQDFFTIGDKITNYCGKTDTEDITVVAMDGSTDTITLSNATYTEYWFGYNGYDLTYMHVFKYSYLIHLNQQITGTLSGKIVLHFAQTNKEVDFQITNGQSVTLENTGVEDTLNEVTFNTSIDKLTLNVVISEKIGTISTIKYKITDIIFNITQTVEFTIPENSLVSNNNTILCSENYTSELYVIKYDSSEKFGIQLKVDGELNDSNYIKTRAYRSDTQFSYGSNADANTDENQKARAFIFDGLHEKALSGIKKDGLISGFIMAITAIELYDGSYVWFSNPVLLNQSFDKATRYEVTINELNYNYLTKKAIFQPINFPLNDTVINNDGYADMSIIPGISYAFVPMSGDRIGTQVYSIPNVLGYYGKIENNNSVPEKYLWLFASYNRLKFKLNSTIDSKYKSLIKSLSIFISPELSIYKTPNAKNYEFIGYAHYSDVDAYHEVPENYLPPLKTDAEILKELSELSSFYKVHEIPFDEINANVGTWIDIDLKGKLGDNLVTQERLTLNMFSSIKAAGQMTYNSMLHAWNIKNVISKGFPLSNFYGNNQGIGQFAATNHTFTGLFSWVQVDIKTDSESVKTIRYRNYEDIENTDIKGIMPMLSFPDSRAYKMTLFMFDVLDWATGHGNLFKKEFQLTKHVSGYFAYYINTDLKPTEFEFVETTDINNKIIPVEISAEISAQNKLKVSSINNPFLFPDNQTYPVGDGTILNVASQSIRTSDGQYGEYPLVCFCTDGLFSLQVGDGTVAYSRIGNPQNYERPISKVICVTPFGIAFISNRGLCMVAGQDIEYLSESMFEKFRTVTLELPDQISTLFALDLSSFNDYLKACTAMIYNPKEQEIIIIHPDKAYNYVYNMGTKQFYRNNEAIINEINNSLPDMQVWTGATVKKVTVIEAGSREISFVTRPIKMQTPDIKRFERVIMRAYLSGIIGTPATACIWGSLDDRNFKLLRGMVLDNNTTRKDIDFGMFGKTTYRSYIIGLSMTVGTDSEIEAVEMQIEKEFLDTKMR